VYLPAEHEQEDSTTPKPIHQDIDEQMARRYHAAGQEIRNSIEDRRAVQWFGKPAFSIIYPSAHLLT
jgi:hypothetical protein